VISNKQNCRSVVHFPGQREKITDAELQCRDEVVISSDILMSGNNLAQKCRSIFLALIC